MELANKMKISEILYEFITDILEWDTDGPNKEVITDTGIHLELKNNTSKNSSIKYVALRRSKTTVMFDMHISVITGIISTRLSELVFGTPDRFYKYDNKWALYIDNDVYLTSAVEEKISWFGFLALVKSIIKEDFSKCDEDDTIKLRVDKLMRHKDCNRQALVDFYDWVVKYRFDRKKYLLQFYTEGVDTRAESLEEIADNKKLNDQGKGEGNKKIIPSERRREITNKRMLNNAGIILNSQAQTMEDIFREAYGV